MTAERMYQKFLSRVVLPDRSSPEGSSGAEEKVRQELKVLEEEYEKQRRKLRERLEYLEGRKSTLEESEDRIADLRAELGNPPVPYKKRKFREEEPEKLPRGHFAKGKKKLSREPEPRPDQDHILRSRDGSQPQTRRDRHNDSQPQTGKGAVPVPSSSGRGSAPAPVRGGEPVPGEGKMGFKEKMELLRSFGVTDLRIAEAIVKGSSGRFIINTRSLNANNKSGAQVFVLTDVDGKQIEGCPALVAFKGRLYPTNTVEKTTSPEEIDLYGDFRISPKPIGRYGDPVIMTPATLIEKVEQNRKYVRVIGREREEGGVVEIGAENAGRALKLEGEFDFDKYKREVEHANRRVVASDLRNRGDVALLSKYKRKTAKQMRIIREVFEPLSPPEQGRQQLSKLPAQPSQTPAPQVPAKQKQKPVQQARQLQRQDSL
jgi:hypothetical protein